MSKKFKGGVVTGDDVQAIFDDALENQYALPAVNVVGTNSVNAVLETAAGLNSPVMIQFSNGGGIFYAGKSLSNENQKSAIAGSVSGAMHVHAMAEAYDVPVILHTDHAARKLLPWIDGLEGVYKPNLVVCPQCGNEFNSKGYKFFGFIEAKHFLIGFAVVVILFMFAFLAGMIWSALKIM